MTILEKLKSLQRYDYEIPNVTWVKWQDIEAIIEELEKEKAEKTKGSFDVGGYFYPTGGIQPLHKDVWEGESRQSRGKR